MQHASSAQPPCHPCALTAFSRSASILRRRAEAAWPEGGAGSRSSLSFIAMTRWRAALQGVGVGRMGQESGGAQAGQACQLVGLHCQGGRGAAAGAACRLT